MAVAAAFNPYIAGNRRFMSPGGVQGAPVPASSSTPVAAPTTLADALAAPAKPDKPVISIGPESDALAKALLAQASQGQVSTPFEALGKLAQLGVGSWAEDKFQKAEKEREAAPARSLSEALAGLPTGDQNAYRTQLGQTLMRLGGQYGNAEWTMKGAELMAPQPAKEPKIEDFYTKDGRKTKGIYDPTSPDGFRPVGGAEVTSASKPTPHSDEAQAYDDYNNGFLNEEGLAARLNEIRAKAKPATFRPLTAEERKQWNIAPDDPNSYGMGADGKPVKVADSDLLSAGAVEQKSAIAAQGAPKIINDMAGQKAGDVEMAKLFAKKYDDITTQGAVAQDAISKLDRMTKLAADPNFYSGPGAAAALVIKQGLALLGGDPNSAAPMEEFKSLANKAAIDSMGGSLGTGFSNADRDYVNETVPSLAATPQGNIARAEVLKRINQRKVEAAAMADQYVQDHGKLDAGFNKELRAYADAHPLFADLGAGAATPKTGGQHFIWNPDDGSLSPKP